MAIPTNRCPHVSARCLITYRAEVGRGTARCRSALGGGYEPRHLSIVTGRHPPRAFSHRLIARFQSVDTGRQQGGKQDANNQIIDIIAQSLVQSASLHLIEHHATVLLAHRGGTQGDHDEPRVVQVAYVAEVVTERLGVDALSEIVKSSVASNLPESPVASKLSTRSPSLVNAAVGRLPACRYI